MIWAPAWTDEELEVIERHYPTGGVAACAPLLPARTPATIKQRAYRLGVSNRPRRQRARRDPVQLAAFEGRAFTDPRLLGELRLASGIDVPELARRGGYTRQAVLYTELGRTTPRMVTVIDLVNALGWELVLRPREDR